MVRADDELPEIEVIDGDDDDPSDGHVDSPSRSTTTWVVGLVVAVGVMAVVGLTFPTDRTPADDGVPSRTTAPPTVPDDSTDQEMAEVRYPVPVSGEWRDLSTTLTGPLGRVPIRIDGPDLSPFMAAVDDDRVLILYTENGGENVAGEILDLRLGTAKPIATSPLRWRTLPMVGWTGSEVIVAGGSNGAGIEIAGAAYNPERDSWRQIAAPPGFMPGSGENQVTGPGAWTGEELISWQGRLAYEPTSDSWREIARSPLAPRDRAAVTATATGRVLVWGGCDPTATDPAQCHADGAIYDPTTDEWTPVPAGPLVGGDGPVAVATTWDDRIVIVVPSPPDPDAAAVAALDPSTLEWHELAGLPDELKMRSQRLVWTGTHVVSWTESLPGIGEAGFVLNPALHEPQDPALGQWRPISVSRVVVQVHASIWTSHGLVVAGGGSRDLFTPTGEPCPGQYDPRDWPDPTADPLDRLPELGATTHDNVAATILLNAQDIAERYLGTVDITVGPGWGVAYEEDDGEIEIHRALDDHTITVHVADAIFCGFTQPAFYPDADGRSVPIRFVSATT